jgi:YVTN family beta-propeller protein
VQSNHTVAIVDGTTYLPVNKVPSGGQGPNGLALSEDGSRLFVVNSDSDHVAVLDVANSYAVLATISVGQSPTGIGISDGTAYVTNFDDGTVSVIDTETMTVRATTAVGHHPMLPAAVRDHAYIPNHSRYYGWRNNDPDAEWNYVQQNKGRDTGISIVYHNGAVEHVLEQYVGFFAAAVDEVHDRVYVTKRDGTAEGLYVLELSTNQLVNFVPMLRPYTVAVNPVTQHVFVVQGDMDEVYVLDATNDYAMIRALNTDPNNGDIPGLHGGQGIDVLGSDVFVSNYAAGTLTVVDDTRSGAWVAPIQPDYIRGWMESGGKHGPLGVPAEPALDYWFAEQQYERGSMYWRPEFSGPSSVYVFDNESSQSGGTDWTGRDSGVWQRYPASWSLSMPIFPAGCPEAWWPNGPMFAIGVTWCNEPTIKQTIGYPIGPEYGAMGGHQVFANGKVFWHPWSDAYYVLRLDNHRWQYYRAHRRYVLSEAEPSIVGRVSLQGRTDHRGVMLANPDGPWTASDESGSFDISYEGQVTLQIRYPGYLDVIAPIKANLDTLLDMGEITLIGGDMNDDNEINILDLALVGAQFGSDTSGADLNGDGTVDILDLTLVGANFGKSGPVSWQR